jgi:sugar phosphate isomerase/epimerase
MKDLFPLAYSTLGCPAWSFDHAVEQAARHGYSALEVRLLNGEIIQPDLTQEVRRTLKSTLQRFNMQIIALGLSTRFSSPIEAKRSANLDQLLRYIELAHDLEVPMVRTFGANVHDSSTLQQTIDWVAEALNAAAPHAEQAGVDIVLETHDAFCRGEHVAAVLAQVPNPHIGAVWDVHHPFRMGETIDQTWDFLEHRLKHVHMKDAVRRADGSWQLVLLGEGEVPCHEIVRLLYRNGYTGYITAEWEKKWHPEIEEPETALPQHAQVLREWFQALDC